jgi:amino acid adenylation domain-containing protein
MAWTIAAVERGQTLHELFEEQVGKTPAAPALMYNDRVVSYGELNRRANQLARFLRSKSIGTESRVGLCLERSVEMIVALLGIIKAGAAYIPLEPTWPKARILEILKDSATTLLLTSVEPAGLAVGFSGETIALGQDWLRRREESGDNLKPVTSPDNLLAVVYTSGTTGKPKGVLITMTPVLNRLTWMRDAYPYRPGDVVLLHRPSVVIGFTTIDCFLPLLNGVPVAILPAPYTGDAAAIVKLSTQRGVSHITASARLWEAILKHVERQAGGWLTLRLGKTGGEPLSAETAELWRRVLPQVPLLNVYGGTEFSSATVCDLSKTSPDGRVPVGAPMPNVRVYVMDDQMRTLPDGAAGEICVGGACVARGYLDSPELTADRFVPDPYSSTPGARLFRTGDVGFWGTEGELELVCRRDHQVKINGFRVELGDVEAALNACSGVRTAAVVPDEEPSGGACLVAYVAPSDKSACSAAALRAALLDRLPAHMVPSRFVLLDHLPLTHTGKIDRPALATAHAVPGDAARPFDAPSTPQEQVLADIWALVLDRDNVGADDDFFELGGDSLLAMQVLSRINDAFGVRIPLKSLFDGPTVKRLALELKIRCEQA